MRPPRRRDLLGSALLLLAPHGTAAAATEPTARHWASRALRADLDDYYALVEEATPEPYLHTGRDRVRRTLAACKAAITAPLSRREFLPILRRLAAAYGIGHHFVNRPEEEIEAYKRAGGRFLPFSLDLDEDGTPRLTRISADAPALAAGDELLAVNDRPARALVDAIATGIPAETASFQRRSLGGGFARLAWEQGLDAPFRIDVRRAGRALTFTWPAQDAPQAPSPSLPPPAPAQNKAPDVGFDYRVLEDGVGFIDYRAMNERHRAAWERFLATTFEELKTAGRPGLIVDLRRNGGGNSKLGETLLDYISDGPYRLQGEKRWRHSRAYRGSWQRLAKSMPELPDWSQTRLASVPLGQTRRFVSELHTPAPHPAGFRGPVAFLIGPGTFSSAMALADGAKTYGLARLIGEPTGGVPTSHGELGYATLPRSHIEVSFCSALFVRASGSMEDRGPVLPDEHVTPHHGEDPGGLDGPLDAARAWIRSARAPG